jgi:hypothetical protein
VKVAKLRQEEVAGQHRCVARYSDYITKDPRAKRASTDRCG